MFCKYCGKEYGDDSVFCSNCGKPTGIEISDIPVKNSHINEKNSSSPNNNGKLVIALASGLVLAVIVLVILLVMVVGKNKSNDKAKVDEKVQQVDEVSIDNKETENKEDISETVNINTDDASSEVEEEEVINEDNNSRKSPKRIDVKYDSNDHMFTLLYSNYEDYPDVIDYRGERGDNYCENNYMKVEYLADDEGGLILGKWFGQFNCYISDATQIYYSDIYMTPMITHYELDAKGYWTQDGIRKTKNNHITYDAQYDGTRLISEHYRNDIIDGISSTNEILAFSCGADRMVNTRFLQDENGNFYIVTEGIIDYTYENDRVIASVKLMSDRKELYSIDYECGRLDDEGRIIYFVTYENFFLGQRDGKDYGWDIEYVESLDDVKYGKNAKCNDYGQVTEYREDDTTYIYSYSEDGRLTECYCFYTGDYADVYDEYTKKYSYNEGGDLVSIENEESGRFDIEYTDDGKISRMTLYWGNAIFQNKYERGYFKKYFTDRKQASVFNSSELIWDGSILCSY